MKKLIVLGILILCLLTGCGSDSKADQSGDVMEIKEKMFVAQTNEIYLNPEDYTGKTVRYEGFVDSFYSKEDKKTYYAVIRYGPGCCGYDANCGFEIEWDGTFPKNKTWVEVTGDLHWDDDEGLLMLKASQLKVLKKRGKETVTQ